MYDRVNHNIMYTSELFSTVETKLYAYVDDSVWLLLQLQNPGIVIWLVSAWCYLWEMKFNASETKSMIVSKSLTIRPHLLLMRLQKERDDLNHIGCDLRA